MAGQKLPSTFASKKQTTRHQGIMGRIIISRGLKAVSPARGFFSTSLLRMQPVLLPQSSQFRCTMSTSATQQPIYAQGEEENKLNPELSKLFESGWELDENKMGLKKTYHFKTYTKVLVRGHHIRQTSLNPLLTRCGATGFRPNGRNSE